MRKIIFVAALILIGAASAQAQLTTGLIDPARVSNWPAAGSSVNSAAYTQCGSTIAAYTGNTDTINNAIAACSANTYVLLGAGTFTLSSSGSVSPGIRIRVPGVVLRGMGADQTSLVIGAGAKDGCGGFSGAICIQSSTATGNYPNDGTTVAWTAGYSQGTSVITVASVTGVVANTTVVWLSQCSLGNSGTSCTSNPENDNGGWFDCDIIYTPPGCAVNGPDGGNQQLNRPQAELFLVTAVNAGTNQVTLNGVLRNPNWASAMTPTATFITPIQGSGVENLSLDVTSLTTSSTAITLYWTYNCWVHGVRMLDIPYAGIWNILGAHDTEEQNYTFGSTITPGQDNYAYNLTSTSDMLIQNNIIQKENGTLFMEGSDTGSVIAYNYSVWDNNGNNTGLNPAYFPHAGDRFELFEGNIANSYFGENFHGPKIGNTLFRNLYTGWESGANWTPTPVVKNSGTTPVRLMHHSRYHNIVGNVLGTPTIATSYSTTTTGFSSGFIYEIGTPDVAPTDSIVGTTRYFWANWDTVTNATRYCGSAPDTGWVAVCGSVSEVPTGISVLPQPLPTVGDTGIGQGALPPSLYLSTRPSWFRSIPFPAIGSDISSGALGVCGGTLNRAGHYSGEPATSNANCVTDTLSAAWAGHANPNPAMDAALNVMGILPDGTNSTASNFNAAALYGGSQSTNPTGPPGVMPLTITTASPLPPATVGTPYSEQFNSTGGLTPIKWTITGQAAQPPGFLFSSSGVLSGTPTLAGNPSFFVQATDSEAPAVSVAKSFTLPISSAEPPPPASPYVIQTSPTSLSFVGVAGAPAPACQTTAVLDTTPAGPLPVKISSDSAWITTSPANAQTEFNLQVCVKTSGLAAGKYSGNAIVTATGPATGGFTVNNSPFAIPVTLTLSAPAPLIDAFAVTVAIPKAGANPQKCTITVSSGGGFTTSGCASVTKQ